MLVLLANPRGFCAGVVRAISIVEQALEIWGNPIYVYHEIVHNKYIINSLSKRGVIFVEDLTEVPKGSVIIFSAHGVSRTVTREAQNRDLIMVDATCPLVTKIHRKVAYASLAGVEAIIIGHKEHPEVKGTIGQYNNIYAGIYVIESILDIDKLSIKNEKKLCFMTQTTLSVEETSKIISALRKRFPNIIGPHKNDICYATSNRQVAVRKLAEQTDLVLVIGSNNSSNSTRLVEIVQQMGKKGYLIDSVVDIQNYWLKNINSIGITAGASVPSLLIEKVIEWLKIKFDSNFVMKELKGNKEKVFFSLPILNLENKCNY
ncbi:MAG: 4-hydroxy-3-methylbut-2-enyl diphosphate reductase [Candidatus Dasytiphilus stammeri]